MVALCVARLAGWGGEGYYYRERATHREAAHIVTELLLLRQQPGLALLQRRQRLRVGLHHTQRLGEMGHKDQVTGHGGSHKSRGQVTGTVTGHR